MLKMPFRIGKSPDPAARVRAMLTRAYQPGAAAPFALMNAEIDALSHRDRAELLDTLESWWDDAAAFARTQPSAGGIKAPDLLHQLIAAFLDLAEISSGRATTLLRWAARGVFVNSGRGDVGIEWVLQRLADAGVVLSDPGADLVDDLEAGLAVRPLASWLYDDARANLYKVLGRAAPSLSEDVATFDAIMVRTLAWAQDIEAWRDRLLAAAPEGAAAIGGQHVTAEALADLDPPEGTEAFLTAYQKPPPALPLAPDALIGWPQRRYFGDTRYRFVSNDWFQAQAAAWRLWKSRYPLEDGDCELAAPKAETDLARLWTVAGEANGAKPTGRWLKAADALMAVIGRERARDLLIESLADLRTAKSLRRALTEWREARTYEFLRQRVAPAFRLHPAFVLGRLSWMEERMFWLVDGQIEMGRDVALPSAPLKPSASDIAFAKGAAWMLGAYGDDEVCDALEAVALSMLVKIPDVFTGLPYRSLATANACVWSLGQIGSVKAVMALSRIKRAARDERLSALVDKAMAQAAEVAGMAVSDLEEIATPTCELDEVGGAERALGEYVARLDIERGRARLSYTTAAGKILKSQPAALKGDAAASEEIKALKLAAAEIDKSLPLIRQRLEDSYLSRRDWSWDNWRARWLDHPLAGVIARRLVWRLEGVGEALQCAWDGEQLRDSRGVVVTGTPDLRVRLWHPLMSEAEEIARWRNALLKWRIVQPFAQAHRQIYPLTPAERETALYSNRFAGHILRQHQYMALAKSRGWNVRHRIWADTPNDEPTYKPMPSHGLYAQWWLMSPQDETPAVTDNQAFVYVHSDRVLFGRLSPEGGREAPVALETVDPLAYSEIMREVDLCVAVASIGNDPTWVDGGPGAASPSDWRRDADLYWIAHNKAAMGVAAKVRAEVLAQILPSLGFGDRLAVKGQSLQVQGKLGAYGVHLGSGNVTMAPSGRYLCIVPAAGAADDIFLPFEGDRTLSIILSKALMLLRDDRVADAGIAQQIREGIG